MKKIVVFSLLLGIIFSSCVSYIRTTQERFDEKYEQTYLLWGNYPTSSIIGSSSYALELQLRAYHERIQKNDSVQQVSK